MATEDRQASPESAPAIEARGLGRRYGRTWALVDVTLNVPRGSTLLVAGRNGSGKSTLFRVLAGALAADTGRLRVGGCDSASDREGLRRQVALLTHHTFAYESLSAYENLRIWARLGGRPAQRDGLMALLEEVGLAARAGDEVHTFSAGMRKRLSFARVLQQKPSIVLLDEPYAQLDPQGLRFVDELVPRLKAGGATVLVAEHLLERGAQLCEHGLVLERGRVAWQGPARALPSEGGLLGSPAPRAA